MRTALFLFIAAGLFGQDFAGEWQGTLKMGTASQRIVLRIEKSPGGWNARSYSVDQSVEAIKATAVSAEGQAIKIALDSIQAKYDGTLSADGKTIKGSLKQVGMTMPLDFERATPGASWYKHDSPHKARFVDVDTNVKLEVLDWGGTGRPLIFLSGLGNSAHIFDDFAPKFVGTHHVYGITRRGYGESSVPTSGYSADRMGDDILAVIEALKIEKPVLAGHSIAGEELSSIGSRFPAKVAGLIYLDAGFPYAFYDKDRGELQMDLPEILQKFQKLLVGKNGGDERKVVKELIAQMPMLEKLLAERLKDLESYPPGVNVVIPPGPALMIMEGRQKYTEVKVPALAIFALPRTPPAALKGYTNAINKMRARDLETTGAQAAAFEKGIPSARVVRLADADHYVFKSNEADVLREMNEFLKTLK